MIEVVLRPSSNKTPGCLWGTGYSRFEFAEVGRNLLFMLFGKLLDRVDPGNNFDSRCFKGWDGVFRKDCNLVTDIVRCIMLGTQEAR
jgi:hypothetical protein